MRSPLSVVHSRDIHRRSSPHGRSRVVLELSLLLQTAHALDIQRVEPTSVGGLVRGQLFMARFQAHAARLTDTHDDHTARLTSARLVLLLGESDANLRNRAGWGAVGVLHQSTLLVVDHDRVVLASGDREAALAGGNLAVVNGEYRVLLHRLTLTTDDEQTTDQGEGEQDENKERDHKVEHGVGEAAVVIAAATDHLVEREHIVDRGGVVGGC